MIGEAFVAVKPETTGFAADTEKGVLGAVTGIAKKAAAILGGAFAVEKGVDFLKSSIEAAREGNKVEAQTGAVIKSTGDAAGETSKKVKDLADSIAQKTGLDHVQIQASENMLLTFTNVRNEMGKGNDIFDRATKLATDFAAATGGDAKSAAQQLGKALQDPATGLSRLQRVGILFTDQQKEQIKAMEASGHTAQAQSIILDEVAKKFGGSAEAQATSTGRLKESLREVKESIGNALIPIIDRVASFAADKLPAILGGISKVFDAFIGGFQNPAAINHVKGLEGALITLGSTVRKIFDEAKNVIDGFTGKFDHIDENYGPFKFGAKLREIFDRVLPVVQKVAGFIQNNLKPILIGVGAALLYITSPVTAVVAAFVILYARFQAVRDVVAAVVDGVREFVEFFRTDVLPVIEQIAQGIAQQFGTLVEAVSTRMDAIKEAIGHVLVAIRDVIAVVLAPIILIWREWGDQIKAIVSIVFDQIRLVIDTAVRIIRDIIDVVLNVINGNWGAAWNALKDIPAAILTYVVGTIEHVLEVMKQIVSGGIEAVVDFFRALPGRLGALAGTIGNAALGIGKAIIEGIGKGLSAAVGFAGDVASSVLRAIKNVINTQIIDRINSGIPDSIGAGPFKVSLPKNPIPRLAAGAIVDPRPGGVIANIAEAGKPEGVFPLPPGVLEGLQAIAATYRSGRTAGGGGPLVENLIFQGISSLDAAEANASSLIRKLRAEAWVIGK